MGARLKRQRETIALLTLKKKSEEEGEGAGRDRTDSWCHQRARIYLSASPITFSSVQVHQ